MLELVKALPSLSPWMVYTWLWLVIGFGVYHHRQGDAYWRKGRRPRSGREGVAPDQRAPGFAVLLIVETAIITAVGLRWVVARGEVWSSVCMIIMMVTGYYCYRRYWPK